MRRDFACLGARVWPMISALPVQSAQAHSHNNGSCCRFWRFEIDLKGLRHDRFTRGTSLTGSVNLSTSRLLSAWALVEVGVQVVLKKTTQVVSACELLR